MQQNGPGQVKAKKNGQTGPAIAAPRPPPSPFGFVDELPTKVRELVDAAIKTTRQDVEKVSDKRYLDGLRRGAYLVAIAVGSLDGDAKMRVMNALEQLEEETAAAERALLAKVSG